MTEFIIKPGEFQQVVRTVQADQDDLHQQLQEVGGASDELATEVIDLRLKAALRRLREEFVDPLMHSAWAWGDAILGEGESVVTVYESFDAEAAEKAFEAGGR